MEGAIDGGPWLQPVATTRRSQHLTVGALSLQVRVFGKSCVASQPRAADEGTLREHHLGHLRARQVTGLPAFPSCCAAFVSAAARSCPQFPRRHSMVRRGLRFESGRGLTRKAPQTRGFLTPGTETGRGTTNVGPHRGRGLRRAGCCGRGTPPTRFSPPRDATKPSDGCGPDPFLKGWLALSRRAPG
jgi:hypothetical protein